MRRALRGMPSPSFLVRRAGSAWLLVGCLMVSVVVTSALVSALLSFYSAALPATVTQELVGSRAMSVTISDEVSGPVASLTRLVSTKMQAAFGDVPHRQYQAIWSNELALPARYSAGTGLSGDVAAVEAASMSGIADYAALTSGSWPAAPQAGQPIPIALPATTAADLHVRTGSVLNLHYVGSRTAARLEVTGLFRPRDPAAPYWRLSQLGTSGVSVSEGFASFGPALVSPAAFATAGRPAGASAVTALQPSAASYVELPAVTRIEPGDLGGLATRLGSAVAALQNDQVSTVTTAMPHALTSVADGLAAARSLLIISGLQLLLLAAAGLALAGRLLASHRDEETALLAARGAARWQLIKPSLAESALTCAIAAAAGAVAGVRLAALLLSSLTGHPATAAVLGLRDAWIGAGFVLLMCLCIVLWPALRPPSIAAIRIRRGRQAVVASVAAAGADLALIALAVVSVRELVSRSAASAGAGIDPVIVAAPALALAGLALIPLRLLPFGAKGLEKLTARGRRLGTAMANWEISRRPVRQSGPALLVILAVGTSTLALAQYQSWQQSVRDQAKFASGAQVRVSLLDPEPMSDVTAITRLRGVTAAMPVSQQSLGNAQLLAIGGQQAAAVVTMRPDLSAEVPASRLWDELDAHQGPPEGLAVPGRPERLAITASMAGGLGGQLGPVSATVIVQDAYGLTYSLPAGTMAADGRSHELIAELGSSAGIAYPLRLLSVALLYDMPSAPTSARAVHADGSAVVTFRAVSASDRDAGPFGAPFAAGKALASWHPRLSSPGLDGVTSSLLKGQASGSVRPLVLSYSATDGAAQLKFSPGHGPAGIPASTLAAAGFGTLLAQVQIAIPPSGYPVPLIATSAFLTANGGRRTVPISIAGTGAGGYVVATVSEFPTMSSGPAVVADEASLQDALIGAGGAPLPATAWWLATANGSLPAGLPAGSSVATAAALSAALQRDPVSAAPVKAALAVGGAAALLAALGFCVSVAASARSRRSQRALLAALGVPAADQAWLFCLEELMISGPAALVGLGLGVGLAHLLIPAVTLTATAGIPVPAVLVRVPLLWVALVAVIVPAIPVLAAVVATLRQIDPAAELRAAEAAG